jgi:hypothetical protein
MTKMEPYTTYRLSEITVDADELRRIKDALDEQLASGIDLYRRIEKLINEGAVPTRKHEDRKEKDTKNEDHTDEEIEKAREVAAKAKGQV